MIISGICFLYAEISLNYRRNVLYSRVTAMKSLYSFLALTCALIPWTRVMAQTTLTSSTPVIGFYKFDVPAGTSAWTCGLVTKKQFQGAMSGTVPSSAKSTITVSTAAWSPATFDLHYVEILSGAQQGLIIDIDPATPNTTTQLTVIGKTTGPGSLGLEGNESFCIRRHATLGTVFKNGAGLQAFSDLVTIIGVDGQEKLFGFDGTNWRDGGFTVFSDNVIIYPGQGFLITSGSGAQLTFGGAEVAYVRSGPLKVPAYGGKRNLIGIVSPVVSTPSSAASSVAGSGLGLVAFLNPFSDVINTFSNDGQLRDQAIFGSDGQKLVDGSFSVDRSGFLFPNGSVFVTTPASDVLYTQPALVP